MITILKGKNITVEWKVVSLDTKQPVDFEGVNAKVFLLAPDNIYTLPFDVVRDDFRGLRMTIPTGYISTGVYDLKVIWLKDALKDKPVYRNVSVKLEVFALTDEASEVTYDGDTIKIATGVESCGRDGLSAYEIAVFRGFAKERSEKEWVESLDDVLASEASRVKAEEERVKAEDERADAEEDRRQSFEISQSLRTKTFNDSEAQRQSIFESKEAQRDDNENSRMEKEEQRKIAESSRKSSEQGRVTAESGRVSAESTRVADENIRKANEQDRVDAEKNRVNAETSRANAEVARVADENIRKSNEQARVSAENGRVSAEAAREAAEGVREATFQSNEAIRQANETSRQDAEVIREENERRREETYQQKVDRDDNAPKLTAGFANNLVGRGEATKEEISFRPSGGDTSIEDGTARIERVKGSTLVWNQLAREIVFTGMSTQDNITFTATMNTGSGNIYHTLVASSGPRKYVCEGRVSNSRGYEATCGRTRLGEVFSTTNGQNINLLPFGSEVEIEKGDTCVIEEPIRLYDLTQMFGAGNEPATIEEFHARKPLNIDEYAYNEGELISNNVDEIKSVGFNAWDEEWVNGYYTKKGFTADTNYVASKNPIKVIAGLKYYFFNKADNSAVFLVAHYDKYDNYIDVPDIDVHGRVILGSRSEYVIPDGVHYIRFFMNATYGTTYNICIHLVHTGYRNGEYEPYKEFRRGIPIKDIKDKDGNQLFPNGLLRAGSVYDEITATKAIKRIGIVDMGTLNWNTDSNRFTAKIIGMESINKWNGAECVCSIPVIWGSVSANSEDMSAGTYLGILYIMDRTYTDKVSFKAAMSGVMLYYELAEPIEVDLPELLNLDYEVSDFGTEEVISDVPTTPMKAEIIYQFNAVDRIRDNSRHTAESVELLNAKADKTTVEAIQKKELQLSVKDNGNIILSNANGESKEFMPATPSGDPMHYAYVDVGAIYNDTDEDIVRDAPWADIADEEDKVVVHKVGCWYLNGLGNLTNKDMSRIYHRGFIQPDSGVLSYGSGTGQGVKTNLSVVRYVSYSSLRTYFFAYNSTLVVLNFKNKEKDDGKYQWANNNSFISSGDSVLQHILGIAQSIPSNSDLSKFKKLKTIKVAPLKVNITFSQCSLLSKGSVLYMIQNCAPTTAITITLEPTLWSRLENDADIITALEAKNAALEGTGGSISLVSA